MFPVAIIHDEVRRKGLEDSVIGGHAINVFCEPRATLDVDFLVCRDDGKSSTGSEQLNYMNESFNGSADNQADRFRDAPTDLEFDLPVQPGYREFPPRGTWEAGYKLSLDALELARGRVEIWEQRRARMVSVEFVL